jgi:hypothetical protein
LKFVVNWSRLNGMGATSISSAFRFMRFGRCRSARSPAAHHHYACNRQHDMRWQRAFNSVLQKSFQVKEGLLVGALDAALSVSRVLP